MEHWEVLMEQSLGNYHDGKRENDKNDTIYCGGKCIIFIIKFSKLNLQLDQGYPMLNALRHRHPGLARLSTNW